jgi:hypothetical protein
MPENEPTFAIGEASRRGSRRHQTAFGPKGFDRFNSEERNRGSALRLTQAYFFIAS